MDGDKLIFVMYDDDDKLMDGAKHLVANGVAISTVYSPMPIHGIDPIIGVQPTRLAINAFLYGITGALLAVIGIRWMMILDWPMNIGGKPNFSLLQNLPAFTPVTFEMTVFFAAHLMVLTYLIRCKLYPGSNQKSPDPRTTDDMFLMEIESHGNDKEIIDLIKRTGAVEVKEEKIT